MNDIEVIFTKFENNKQLPGTFRQNLGNRVLQNCY